MVLDINTTAQKSKGNKQSLQGSSLRKYQCVQLGSSNDCGSASSAAVQMGQKPGGKERQLAQLAKQPLSLLILSASLSASFAFSFPSPSYWWEHQVPGPAQVVQVVQLLQGTSSIRTVVRRPGNVERARRGSSNSGGGWLSAPYVRSNSRNNTRAPKVTFSRPLTCMFLPRDCIHWTAHSPDLNPIKHRSSRN